MSQADTRGGGKHSGRHLGPQPVGDSGSGVRIVHDDRQAAIAAGRDQRGVRALDGAEGGDLGRSSASAGFIAGSVCPADWPAATTTRGAVTPSPDAIATGRVPYA